MNCKYLPPFLFLIYHNIMRLRLCIIDLKERDCPNCIHPKNTGYIKSQF